MKTAVATPKSDPPRRLGARLADRYRPTRFSDLAGQAAASKYFRSIAERKSPPSTLLLAGPSGTGKTTSAWILAAALNCPDGKDGDPCGECSSCQGIFERSTMSVISLDASSAGSIEEIRNLRSNLQTTGWSDWRVVIIDEAHAMSTQAQEGLLTVLEGPPVSTVFVLATTDPDGLLDTVRARANPLEFEPVGPEDIAARLREVVDREDADISVAILKDISVDSSGSVRSALQQLEMASAYGAKTVAQYRRFRRAIASGEQEILRVSQVFTAVSAQELCSPGPAIKVRPALLGPLVLAGDRVILGARTGHGKTTFALQMARAILLGEDFLGWKGAGDGMRVLYIDAEQGIRTIRRRLGELGLDRQEDLDVVRVPEGLALDRRPNERRRLESLLDKGQYGLVVADPLYKLHQGDSSDERSAVDLMKTFDRWREQFGFALILPVHTRKAPSSHAKLTMDDLFGSSAYLRGAEVVLGLQRMTGHSNLAFLKDREGDLPYGETWRLAFELGSGFRRATDKETYKPIAIDLVKKELADRPDSTIKELQAQTGRKERVVRQALTDLEAQWTTGPGREKLWRLPSPLSPLESKGVESRSDDRHAEAAAK